VKYHRDLKAVRHAKSIVHKWGAKRPKEGKKDKYRISSFLLGRSEWRRCTGRDNGITQ